ncbi:hypothetical protein JCM10296v2_006287 [Rhodotorula toruloides]
MMHPAFELANKATFVVDEEGYNAMRREFEKKLRGGPLTRRIHSPDFMWQGLAATHNVGCKPHFDSNDALMLFTAMFCFGAFEGGHATFPQIGVRLEYRQSDMMLLKSRVLLHGVEACDGVRHGVMLIWRELLFGMEHEGVDWEKIKTSRRPGWGVTKGDEAAAKEADEEMKGMAESSKKRKLGGTRGQRKTRLPDVFEL